MATHGAPRVPGDLEDDGGYRETDQWIGDLEPEGDHGGAGDYSETDVTRLRMVRPGRPGRRSKSRRATRLGLP